LGKKHGKTIEGSAFPLNLLVTGDPDGVEDLRRSGPGRGKKQQEVSLLHYLSNLWMGGGENASGDFESPLYRVRVFKGIRKSVRVDSWRAEITEVREKSVGRLPR